MKTSLVALAMCALPATSGCDRHKAHDHHADVPPPAEGVNPVQHEMRLLLEALHAAVTGIANGDVKALPEALHKVHGAKESTATALKAGAYKPPKNGDKVARFSELDGQFHHDLEQLVISSSKNDLPGTADALGRAIQRCHGCHSEFRF